jgi:hypothetical protein
MRQLLESVIGMMPSGAEYTQVLLFALEECRRSGHWEEAWSSCEKKYERYNWIHSYPNAAAEVVALWYGSGDFDATMNIIALAGQDVDCNAAQIATVLGIAHGLDGIAAKWRDPIGDDLVTYVRGMKRMTISSLASWTTKAVRKAQQGERGGNP